MTFATALFMFFTTASEEMVAPVMACIWLGFSGFLYLMYSTFGWTSTPLNWSLKAGFPYPVAEARGLELVEYLYVLEFEVLKIEAHHDSHIALKAAAVRLEGYSNGLSGFIDAEIYDKLFLGAEFLLQGLEILCLWQDLEYGFLEFLCLVGLYHRVSDRKDSREHRASEGGDNDKVQKYFN